MVSTGGLSFVPDSTSVKMKNKKLNRRFDGMSRSSIQNQLSPMFESASCL